MNKHSKPTMVSTPEIVDSINTLIFASRKVATGNFCRYSTRNHAFSKTSGQHKTSYNKNKGKHQSVWIGTVAISSVFHLFGSLEEFLRRTKISSDDENDNKTQSTDAEGIQKLVFF